VGEKTLMSEGDRAGEFWFNSLTGYTFLIIERSRTSTGSQLSLRCLVRDREGNACMMALFADMFKITRPHWKKIA
jgi:hypothetical protein